MGCNALCGKGLGRSIPASQGNLGEKGEKGARIQAAVELRESNTAAGTNTPREWTLFNNSLGQIFHQPSQCRAVSPQGQHGAGVISQCCGHTAGTCCPQLATAALHHSALESCS